MMPKNMLKITDHGTYRAQLFEIGAPDQPTLVDEQPVVVAKFMLPLEDGRELGGCLYQWMEIHLTSASAEDGEEEEEPFVVWAEDRGGWWRAASKGYTPNALEAGVFTSKDQLNLTKSDHKMTISSFLRTHMSAGEGTVGGWLEAHARIDLQE